MSMISLHAPRTGLSFKPLASLRTLFEGIEDGLRMARRFNQLHADGVTGDALHAALQEEFALNQR